MKKLTYRTADYRFFIGIDPGHETGLSMWDRDLQKLHVESTQLHRAMESIREAFDADLGRILVRLEDARLRKWIPRMPDKSREAGRREGAGYVKGHCTAWEDFLEDLGVDYELVAPKNNRTKMRAEAFRHLTKYPGKTSEHGRDAAMLVYGM